MSERIRTGIGMVSLLLTLYTYNNVGQTSWGLIYGFGAAIFLGVAFGLLRGDSSSTRIDVTEGGLIGAVGWVVGFVLIVLATFVMGWFS